MRKDGRFIGMDGSIPEGQGIINANLSECHELVEMVCQAIYPGITRCWVSDYFFNSWKSLWTKGRRKKMTMKKIMIIHPNLRVKMDPLRQANNVNN